MYTELARCCPTDSATTHQWRIGGIAYNDLIDCSGLDTFFYGNGGDGNQSYIYENDVFSTSDTTCDKCEGMQGS